ncbi:hypothetical protein NDU88_008160 [Pleurodeles waltl]|uniref:Uncharacterized protein n=1 Tax=Pleurodeles waltl TaxID=8319 RepID=A0AAV7RTV5_PLEWA|nr:hypothetical protein NDU88_008160 [Pleurodeles waltl]
MSNGRRPTHRLGIGSERWVLTAQATRAFLRRVHFCVCSWRPSSRLLFLRSSYWTPLGPSRQTSLRRTRQPVRLSPESKQGSTTSHRQQAARSPSFTRSHSLAPGSPYFCPNLLVLRNSGPAQPGPSRQASLRWTRQPGRRSLRSNQGSSTSRPQQATRSLSLNLTRSHSLAPGSSPVCPTLFVPHNSGPAQTGPSGQASLRRSRQPGRRSPEGNRGSSTSQPQQAVRSLSLTRSHSLAPGSPHLCPTLLALRNSGPAWSGSTCAPGPGRLESSLQLFLSVRWSRRPARLCNFKIASPAPGRMPILIGPHHWLPGGPPSAGLGSRVVSPSGAARGVPRLSRSS